MSTNENRLQPKLSERKDHQMESIEVTIQPVATAKRVSSIRNIFLDDKLKSGKVSRATSPGVVAVNVVKEISHHRIQSHGLSSIGVGECTFERLDPIQLQRATRAR